MFKYIVGFLFLAVAINFAQAEMKCNPDKSNVSKEWIDLQGACANSMRQQIQKEIDASYQYLAMGAHFSRDTVNRPGFADFFFNAAKEEREHGSKLIEYLSMRGLLTSDVTNLIKVPEVPVVDWESGVAALEDALALEIKVTKSIRELIVTCEKRPNDYHLVDYLTGVYLEEQLHGQRELAGKISTLQKMMDKNGALGEFLFDKQF